MIAFFNWLVKITGWPPYRVVFNTAVYYEDKKVQGRRIKGPAIVICNHTSVWDYAAMLFVFWTRTLRCQMAEVLFKKKPLALFLKCMGGIYVDRHELSSGFIGKSEDILKKGGVVEIFPESRLPLKGEQRPLPFKPSAAMIALKAEVPVIPVYTNGNYFTSKRARVIIGKPINVHRFVSEERSEKENINYISEMLREKIIDLEKQLNAKLGR